jgi:hypothetical protein
MDKMDEFSFLENPEAASHQNTITMPLQIPETLLTQWNPKASKDFT